MCAELIALGARIKALLAEIQEVLAAKGQGEHLRDGLVVAIAGPPNVGKSTLINQLARREVAIVSPHAGTTRDVIEVQLDLDGYPVTVSTAGIRETDDGRAGGCPSGAGRAADADLSAVAGNSPAWAVAANDGAAPVWTCATRSISRCPIGQWPRRRGKATSRFRPAGGMGCRS